MKTFPNETKEQIVEVQNGICAYRGCFEEINSIHHLLINTKQNRNNFPLFIQSPMNAKGLCFNHHTNNSHEFVVTANEAMVYEKYLLKICEDKAKEG